MLTHNTPFTPNCHSPLHFTLLHLILFHYGTRNCKELVLLLRDDRLQSSCCVARFSRAALLDCNTRFYYTSRTIVLVLEPMLHIQKFLLYLIGKTGIIPIDQVMNVYQLSTLLTVCKTVADKLPTAVVSDEILIYLRALD